MSDMVVNLLMVIGGLVGLYFGASWLVKGSVDIALCFKISPLIIGLTVVAFGTSAPEAFVGVNLNMGGYPDTAIGNVVGSNICNIALMLGIAALIRPIAIKPLLVRRDMPLLLGSIGIFTYMIWDRVISPVEGGILFALILVYVLINVMLARSGKLPHEVASEFEAELEPEVTKVKERPFLQEMGIGIFFLLIGLVVLVAGAEALQRGAVAIAKEFGVSDAIIGLTLVAIGTSLPEIATAIVASVRNHGDIIAGNAIGSCIFNICAVIGIVALIRPIVGSEAIQLTDLAVMAGATLIVTPIMISQKKILRWEGLLLLIGYGVYCYHLFQRTGGIGG